MLIKFYIQPDAFYVFRKEDIESISPIISRETDVKGYVLRLTCESLPIHLTAEQAFNLTLILDPVIVDR